MFTFICSFWALIVIGFAQQIQPSSNGNFSFTNTRNIIEEDFSGSFANVAPPKDDQAPKLDIIQDLFSPQQVKDSHRLYFAPDELNGSFSDVSLTLLTAQVQLAPRIATFHRYDNERELRLASGPNVNQELCIHQLEQLNRRAEVQLEEKYAGRDINFHQLLDTFGRAPSGTFLINTLWTGMYRECLRLRIETGKEKLNTRYCLASFKHKSWPDNQVLGDLIGFESGVCLPEACDSLNYKNKFQLVQKLMDFNARIVDANQTELNYLYCLPDEKSDMRSWWKSQASIVSLALIFSWLLLLLYSTIKYEKILKADDLKKRKNSYYVELLKGLSVINNYKKLTGYSQDQSVSVRRVINFKILDGVKVLSLICIVLGHTCGMFLKYSNNPREMATPTLKSFLFLTSIQPASFIVDIFFTISGMFSAYKLFEKNQSAKIARSPLAWLAFTLIRYVRIIPTYAFVVMYAKYLAIYTGSGPLWEYGTSSQSIRRFCIEESWFWSTLFVANFKPIHEHCILPGWYLANDFQFWVITPIFLYVLHKRPTLGKILISLVMATSMLVCSLLISRIDDYLFDPLARSAPHGSTLTMTTFMPYYSWPYFRISAYLLGILVGYSLYNFEQRKKLILTTQNTVKLKEKDWPIFIRKYGKFISLVLLINCVILPLQSSTTPLSDYYNRILLTLTWPGLHLFMPIAVTLYILPSVTGYGNKFVDSFLSAPIWRSLSKLNLSVLIVHVEIILHIFNAKNQLLHINFESHVEVYLFCLLATYIGAFLIHLLVEAPMGYALNLILSKVIITQPQKKDQHELESKPEKILVVSSNRGN